MATLTGRPAIPHRLRTFHCWSRRTAGLTGGDAEPVGRSAIDRWQSRLRLRLLTHEQPCHRSALCSNPTNASCLLARALLLALPVPPGPEDPGMSMGATLT